jgi:hypothetical protein
VDKASIGPAVHVYKNSGRTSEHVVVVDEKDCHIVRILWNTTTSIIFNNCISQVGDTSDYVMVYRNIVLPSNVGKANVRRANTVFDKQCHPWHYWFAKEDRDAFKPDEDTSGVCMLSLKMLNGAPEVRQIGDVNSTLFGDVTSHLGVRKTQLERPATHIRNNPSTRGNGTHSR